MKVDRLLTVPVAIDIKAAFARAWELYKMHPFFFSMYMLLILSFQGMVVIYAQEYMIVYSTLLAPPFYAGFYLVANKMSRGEEVVYPDFFAGFRFWIPICDSNGYFWWDGSLVSYGMEPETHHAQLVAVSGIGSDFYCTQCSGDFACRNWIGGNAAAYFFGAICAV
jgi:hypothetical protein